MLHAPDHRHGGIDDTRRRDARNLTIVLVLVATYVVVEIIGGLITNSLALLADAAHTFSDVAALALSLFALHVASRPPSGRRTYGYYRTEILAALLNGSALIAVSFYVFVEAYGRLVDPPEVWAVPMIAIAAGGVALNGLGLWILRAGKTSSLNVRGAWLHIFADAIGSAGTVLAGTLILLFGWRWADPVASVLIGGLVMRSAWRLVKEAVAVLMESAPAHIDVEEVREAIGQFPEVVEVRDLHVWSISTGLISLSVHVAVDDFQKAPALLPKIRRALRERFGIDHSTVQIEPRHVDGPRLPI